MVDISSGAFQLRLAWKGFVHRFAVVAGCLAALTSLFQHVPVHVACGRGAVAWAAVQIVGRAGAALLERTSVTPRAPADGDAGSPEPAETS